LSRVCKKVRKKKVQEIAGFKSAACCPRQARQFAQCARFISFMDLAPTISTQGLTRRFGELIAVDGIDLALAPGQFFASSAQRRRQIHTIKMLTGLLAPSAGRIEILGLDMEKHPVEVKRQIGVVPEGMALFGRLTGSEFLNFAGRMYGLDRVTAAKRTANFSTSCNSPITEKAGHRLLSRHAEKTGNGRRVIHGPKVLFLDEPFEGVDAIAAGTLKSMLQGMIGAAPQFFSPRMCSKSWSASAVTSPSSSGQARSSRITRGAARRRRGADAHAGGDGAASAPGEKLTLEQIFLRTVAASAAPTWNFPGWDEYNRYSFFCRTALREADT